jgi:hypothetical protein
MKWHQMPVPYTKISLGLLEDQEQGHSGNEDPTWGIGPESSEPACSRSLLNIKIWQDFYTALILFVKERKQLVHLRSMVPPLYWGWNTNEGKAPYTHTKKILSVLSNHLSI